MLKADVNLKTECMGGEQRRGEAGGYSSRERMREENEEDG